MPIPDEDFDPSFLELAVRYNDFNEAKRLLKQASPQQRKVLIRNNKYGAFHHAVDAGQIDFVKLILPKVAPSDPPNPHPELLFFNPSSFNLLLSLLSLNDYLNENERHNILSSHKYGALAQAVHMNHPDIALFLLKNALPFEREGLIEKAIHLSAFAPSHVFPDKIECIKIVLDYATPLQKKEILSRYARGFISMAVISSDIPFLTYVLCHIEPSDKAYITKWLVVEVSSENKLFILTHYLSLFNNEQRQELILNNKEILYTVNFHPFKLLFDCLDEDKQRELQPDILVAACRIGAIEIVDFILTRLAAEKKLDGINEALSAAIRHGQLAVVKLLFDRVSSSYLKIKDDDLIKAVGNAYWNINGFKILKYLLETKPFIEIQHLFELANFKFFIGALAADQTDLIEILINKLGSSDLLNRMIQFEDYDAFYLAGCLKVFQLLSDQIEPEKLQEIIAKDNFKLFFDSTQLTSPEICEHLISIVNPDKLQNMLSSSYTCFADLCSAGHYKTVSLMLEKVDPAHKQNMISAAGYRCFVEAARNGHADIVNLLLNEVDPLQKQARHFLNQEFQAFLEAANKSHLGVLKLLVEHVDPARKQDMYRRHVIRARDLTLDFLLSLDPSYKELLSKIEKKRLELYRKRVFEIKSTLMSLGLPSEVSDLITQQDSPVYSHAQTRNKNNYRMTLLNRYGDIWYEKESRIMKENTGSPEKDAPKKGQVNSIPNY